MAEGGRRRLLMTQELVWGTFPSSPAAANIRQIRTTGGALEIDRTSVVSKELRPDRMIPSLRLGNKYANMDLAVELSYGNFEDILESALMGRFITAGGANPILYASGGAGVPGTSASVGMGTCTVTAASWTFARTTGSFIADGFAVGDWVIMSGFANPANNGLFRVSAVVALTLTVDGQPTLTNEAKSTAGASIDRWQGCFSNLAAVTVAVAAGTGVYTLSAGTWAALVTPALAVGDYITFAGFTNGANNGTFKISAIAGLTLTVVNAASVTETAHANIAYYINKTVLKAATQKKSFAFEDGYTDIGQYISGYGLMVNKTVLSVKPAQVVTAVFSFIGKGGLPAAAASQAVNGFTAAATNDPFDSFNGTVQEGGLSIATATGIDLTIDNGLGTEFAVFSQEATRLAAGRANITFNLSVFFDDATIFNKFINETPSSVQFSLKDAAGDQYTFVLPNVKYTDSKRDIKEANIMLSMPGQALLDPTSGTELYIVKNAA